MGTSLRVRNPSGPSPWVLTVTLREKFLPVPGSGEGKEPFWKTPDW